MTAENGDGMVKVYQCQAGPEVGVTPPDYLKENNGLLSFEADVVKEGSQGPFNRVYDFGASKNDLRIPVTPEERILTNEREDLIFLAFENPDLGQKMRDITALANSTDRSFDNSDDRREYRAKLGMVYQALAAEVKKRIGESKTLFLPPKNGGIFVREVYQAEGIPDQDFYDYRMSRVLVGSPEGESLMVGMHEAENNPDIMDYDTFVFADDCMASNISAVATLEYLKEKLTAGGKDLSQVRVIISVSAGVQRSLEDILSARSKEHFGFGSIEAIAITPVYQMTDNFYLKELDGRFTVGDMGKWTLPPTDN